MEFSPNLVPVVMDEATGLDARIANMRNHIATEFGLILPEIRLTDNPGLPPGTYAIRIQGVEAAKSTIETDRVLVLLPDEDASAPDGRTVAEPVYGAPARWIAPSQQEQAALMGLSVVTPTEVVATHLLEVVKSNFGRLFNRRSLRRLLDEFTAVSDPTRAEANRRMLEEFVPDKMTVDTLQAVLRLLLEERVSVRNLPLIFEAIAEANGSGVSAEVLCEHVRHRLGFQLVAGVQEPDGALPLIQLAPSWEEMFQSLPDARRLGHRRRRPAAGGVQPPRRLGRRQDRPGRRPGALSGAGHLDAPAAVPAHGDARQGHPQPGPLLRGDRPDRAPRRAGARLMARPRPRPAARGPMTGPVRRIPESAPASPLPPGARRRAAAARPPGGRFGGPPRACRCPPRGRMPGAGQRRSPALSRRRPGRSGLTWKASPPSST